MVRADDEKVHIGSRSNLQDGVLVHADPGFPVHVDDRVTIGHGAVIHGAVVELDCIIGMRAVLLNGVRIGRGSIVAAGAVVREGSVIPAGSLVVGVPAQVRREVTDEERDLITESATEYVAKATRHRRQARPAG
ncbi:gamma carbonic anhydrase family protein [Micromonospora sp. NPDC005161]